MFCVCQENIKSTDECLQSYSSFIEKFGKQLTKKAKTLTSRKAQQIEVADHPLLYVAQREFATICKFDNIRMIGTDMMTTCHCVIITSSHLTSLGHFDGCCTLEGISDLLTSFNSQLTKLNSSLDGGGVIKLHLIGGFLDDRETSVELSMEILNGFALLCAEFGMEIHLETFACSSLNTCETTKIFPTASAPIVYGVAVLVESGDIFPAVFSEESKHPAQVLRGAYSLYGRGRMRNIYNNEKKYVEIESFTFGDTSSVREILCRSDTWILKNLSTSPDVEPDNFVSNIRQTLIFIYHNSDPAKSVFKNNKSLKYRLTADTWTAIG